MNDYSATTVFAGIQNAISEFTNVEPDEINITDHLETDLMLDPATDLPRIMSLIAQELEADFDPDAIKQFIKECQDNPDKAMITELISLIQDEIEFS